MPEASSTSTPCVRHGAPTSSRAPCSPSGIGWRESSARPNAVGRPRWRWPRTWRRTDSGARSGCSPEPMRTTPRYHTVAVGGDDTGVAHARRAEVTLDDVYAVGRGRVLMSGIQAIVRLVLDQRRLDHGRGLDTAAFVSGYEGSPLAGLDLELGRAHRRLDEEGVVFAPALNEELAATAVAGTQLLADVPGHDHEGVVGFWYGKNPGLDRAADAIRHGNYSGTAPLGGAVALIGDDPTAKSSTLPSSSVSMARGLHLPLLSPGSVADVVRLGLHAVALSRYSGLWAGLQIEADVADAAAGVGIGAAWPEIPLPDTTRVAPPPLLVGPSPLGAE